MSDLPGEAGELVRRLGLAPHPEGGWYRETWRSPLQVRGPRGVRPAMTVIHYLLAAGDLSAFHCVHSEEAWFHAAGGPLELHVLDASGGHEDHRLGPGAGRAQVVVPAGAWQAARPAGQRWVLSSCVVAPGFEFEDFQMARREDIAALRPDLAARLDPLCRPGT
jgi:hypothetical protein